MMTIFLAVPVTAAVSAASVVTVVVVPPDPPDVLFKINSRTLFTNVNVIVSLPSIERGISDVCNVTGGSALLDNGGLFEN